VCNPSGSPVDPEQRQRVDRALVAATRAAAEHDAVAGGAVAGGMAAGATDTPG
jgi:[protein-PII] uridylyltransferase